MRKLGGVPCFIPYEVGCVFSDVLRMVKVTQSLVNLFNLMKDDIVFLGGRTLRIRDRDEIRFEKNWGFLTES